MLITKNIKNMTDFTAKTHDHNLKGDFKILKAFYYEKITIIQTTEGMQ